MEYPCGNSIEIIKKLTTQTGHGFGIMIGHGGGIGHIVSGHGIGSGQGGGAHGVHIVQPQPASASWRNENCTANSNVILNDMVDDSLQI